MDAIGQLGCIVCKEVHCIYSPASIHHIEGRTKPGAHLLTIPLCYHHHQGSVVVSRHGTNRKTFAAEYGKTEYQWLELCKELVNGN